MSFNLQTGKKGEEFAAIYLSQKGFEIIHTNWRYSRWEVDIIATKNNTLHFIEVKTRTSRKYGFPEDKVDKKKIQNLIDAAEGYLYLNPQWKRIQFDILSITLHYNQSPEFFFIEDVYL